MSAVNIILTGPIASGKSVIANDFKSLGAEIIDTDDLNRELQKPGTEPYIKLRELLSDDYFQEDGTVRRDALRKLIASSKYFRIRVEHVMHPAIRQLSMQRIREASSDVAVLIIPLLFDPNNFPESMVVVVDTDKKTRIKRVAQRDGLGKEEALILVEIQQDVERYLELSDISINGALPPDRRIAKVRAIYDKCIIQIN